MPPFQLPAPLIHLIGICRPRLLRPDLRVKSIANVDFRGLRKEGFNAVVIDKDNCLTLPNRDELFPPLTDAWSRLRKAFPPGRVLVVSNSAGTRKDPGEIAAEHVALQLHSTVLLHAKPKPACGGQILKYFRGELGAPRTLQGAIKKSAAREMKEEKADERMLVDKWLKEVDGPICGPPIHTPPSNADPFWTKGVSAEQQKALDDSWDALTPPTTHSPALPPIALDPSSPSSPFAKASGDEPLRILVVGDRLFTDTLLAHRLRLHLGVKDPLMSERVISIHTTLLPQPRDMRVLRWIENRLCGGSTRLRETMTDWGRFVIPEQTDLVGVDPTAAVATAPGLLQSLREVPPLTLSPSSWRPLPLLFGFGRGLAWIIVASSRAVWSGLQWSWAKIRTRTVQTKEVVVEEIKQEQKLNAAP